MEISKERLLEIASMSDKVLSDGRIISPGAYQSVTSIEITMMARMLLCYIGKDNKNQMDSDVDIYGFLDGWGAWVAAGNSSIEWQLVAEKYSGIASHGKKTRRQCNNDEGCMIDDWVLKLRQYKSDEYELIIAHFVMCLSLRAIAKKQKCSDGTIRKKIRSAVGFLDGILSISFF